ncbi:MAG: ABC transporter ATP-binding protein [Rhodospirillales bacterium]|nr:ABC transporter ATP-binding protein [Rhodospirillales bacterium]
MTAALDIADLRKSFGRGADIIRGLSLRVAEGERHAVIGPNGAGKSTLFHLVSGLYAPDGGQIRLHGRPIAGLAPHRINRLGLSRSFQITSVFPKLSVFENLRLGILARQGWRFTLYRRVAGLPGIGEETRALIDQVRLAHVADRAAGNLTYSEQRALEIGMALASDPRVLLLDEPTSGMSRAESDYMVDLIRAVTRRRTLVVVEHDMDVVFSLCDRISVLVYGQIIASDSPAAIRADRRVQEAYLGEEAG